MNSNMLVCARGLLLIVLRLHTMYWLWYFHGQTITSFYSCLPWGLATAYLARQTMNSRTSSATVSRPGELHSPRWTKGRVSGDGDTREIRQHVKISYRKTTLHTDANHDRGTSNSTGLWRWRLTMAWQTTRGSFLRRMSANKVNNIKMKPIDDDLLHILLSHLHYYW